MSARGERRDPGAGAGPGNGAGRRTCSAIVFKESRLITKASEQRGKKEKNFGICQTRIRFNRFDGARFLAADSEAA